MEIGHVVDVACGLDLVIAGHVDPDGDDEDDKVQDKCCRDPRQQRTLIACEVEQRGQPVRARAPMNVAMNAGLIIARSMIGKPRRRSGRPSAAGPS
jgi:hypothetical protein